MFYTLADVSNWANCKIVTAEAWLRSTTCSSYPGWGPGPGRAWVVCRGGRRPWQPRTGGGRSPARSGLLDWPAGGSRRLRSGTLDEKVNWELKQREAGWRVLHKAKTEEVAGQGHRHECAGKPKAVHTLAYTLYGRTSIRLCNNQQCSF